MTKIRDVYRQKFPENRWRHIMECVFCACLGFFVGQLVENNTAPERVDAIQATVESAIKSRKP